MSFAFEEYERREREREREKGKGKERGIKEEVVGKEEQTKNNKKERKRRTAITGTVLEEEKERFGLGQKIVNATQGLNNHFIKLLKKQLLDSNIETICDYILAINAESNPSLNHKRNQLQVLCYLSEYCGNQTPFIKMTRNNILSYLDSLRRPEESDPLHKWIGTYNLRKAYISHFFRWLYNPNLSPRNRSPTLILTLPSHMFSHLFSHL